MDGSHMRMLLLLTGCFEPSGGGYSPTAPPNIEPDKPIWIQYELYVWGSGSTDIERRYRDVLCHFRVIGKTKFSKIEMKLISKSDSRGIYQCMIPAAFAKSQNVIQYCFDEYLDGHYNKHKWKSITVP
jgi:hypothetical protein